MTIAEVIRDAPVGQLCRLYLGLKIAPYVDEQEGFGLSQPPAPQEVKPETDATRDLERDEGSDQDSSLKATSEKDIERNAADEPSTPPHTQAKADPNAIEWSSPTDRDNPQNWSTLRKTFVFGQICLLTFASECDASQRALQELTMNLNNSLQCLSYHHSC